MSQKDLAGLNWCINQLKLEDYQQMISEKLVKFSLFGHMITGTPDLVYWTRQKINLPFGTINLVVESLILSLAIGFSFYCYAYSLYELNQIGLDDQVELALMYLDEKSKVNKSVSYVEVVAFLKSYWLKSFNPDEVNQDHCSKCNFSNIYVNYDRLACAVSALC